jgi:hypothetical protein
VSDQRSTNPTWRLEDPEEDSFAWGVNHNLCPVVYCRGSPTDSRAAHVDLRKVPGNVGSIVCSTDQKINLPGLNLLSPIPVHLDG